MSHTATPTSPITEVYDPRLPDRDEHQALIAAGLTGALAEPGF